MPVLKCKICGGDLELTAGASVCACQYCGTMQTLPKISGDHSATLYERADHFRRNGDFDKAMAIYEQILNEDSTDAEAYWSLVLCRYGIEYVEDSKSSKRIATVNRMQYTSVLADGDYKAAIKYAEPEQRAIYETEAKEIDAIQKGILEISQREAPFDVFICYKETDHNGRRTPDSVLANELYHQLTNEGYKVFFARITLEDKLGSAYEPYIFAALNSAKVMVVLGTKPEYFNAVWVRNEWSRYLSLIRGGANKVLIPAYRDMDPYDLPEEFSHLQAQDMSKLGFMQDLLRGIEKLVGSKKEQPVAAVSAAAVAATAPLLRRAFLFLEDGDWESAKEYFEKVLDADPECGEAYLGEMMVDLKIRSRESLSEQQAPFDSNPYYKKVLRFGDEKLKRELADALGIITQRAERTRLAAAYKSAEMLLKNAGSDEDYLKAESAFLAIRSFEDAGERAKQCREKYVESHFGGRYAAALALMKGAKTQEAFLEAEKAFNQIKEYKDAAQLSAQCAENAAQCAQKAALAAKNAAYTEALALMTGNKVANYSKAIEKLEKIRGFKDVEDKIEECRVMIQQINMAATTATKDAAYAEALALMKGNKVANYKKAIEKLQKIRGFKDTEDQIEACRVKIQQINMAAMTATAEKKKAVQQKNKAFREKLPIIKKVALVAVPLLIVAILCVIFLPQIDFSRLGKKDGVSSPDDFHYNTSGNSVTITGYKGTSPNVVIPDTIEGLPVTYIGNRAFLNNTKITSVTIPGSVTTIGNETFKNCTNLASLTLCDGIDIIGDEAFFGCTALTAVTIPGSVKAVGNSAFAKCTALNALVLSEGVNGFGSSVFVNCTALTSVTIPGSVKYVGSSMFSGCEELTTVSLSEGVAWIGGFAFSNCTKLTTVVVPSSLSYIYEHAFYRSLSLTSITFPGSMTAIERTAFLNSGLQTVYVSSEEQATKFKYEVPAGCQIIVQSGENPPVDDPPVNDPP